MNRLLAARGPAVIPTSLDGARVRASLDQVALALHNLSRDLDFLREADAGSSESFAAVHKVLEQLRGNLDASVQLATKSATDAFTKQLKPALKPLLASVKDSTAAATAAKDAVEALDTAVATSLASLGTTLIAALQKGFDKLTLELGKICAVATGELRKLGAEAKVARVGLAAELAELRDGLTGLGKRVVSVEGGVGRVTSEVESVMQGVRGTEDLVLREVDALGERIERAVAEDAEARRRDLDAQTQSATKLAHLLELQQNQFAPLIALVPALSVFLASTPLAATTSPTPPQRKPSPVPRSPAPPHPKNLRRTSFNSSPALSALPNGRLDDSFLPTSARNQMPHSRPPAPSQRSYKRHISQSQASTVEDADQSRPSWEASAGGRDKRRRVIVQDEYDDDDEEDDSGQRDDVDQLAGASQAGE